MFSKPTYWRGLRTLVAGLALMLLATGWRQRAAAVEGQSDRKLGQGAAAARGAEAVGGHDPAVGGRVSIPDKGSGNLIQPAGQDWRLWHQWTLPKVGMIGILGMLVLLGLFFMIRGRIRIDGGWSGQTIMRFGGLDRFAHWLTAMSFIVLGLTGLNLTFGKSIVLPIVGPETFTALTQIGKFVHNYVSFAFALGLVLMFVLWMKDNLPHPRDLLWIVQGGGLFGKFHPTAARFNFGQKLIFWAVILGGAGLAVRATS